MKILTREQFLRLPSGVLYTKYEPCCFGDLEVKYESLDLSDWIAQPIIDAFDCQNDGEFASLLYRSQETGSSIPVSFDCASWDGMFDRDQLFCVWERSDVLALIEYLGGVAGDSYPEITA